MEYSGIIVTIAGGFLSLIGTIIGLAWKGGTFTGVTAERANATTVAEAETRIRLSAIETNIAAFAVQIARVEESHRSIQEFRREMLAAMDTLREAIYRGPRP